MCQSLPAPKSEDLAAATPDELKRLVKALNGRARVAAFLEINPTTITKWTAGLAQPRSHALVALREAYRERIS